MRTKLLVIAFAVSSLFIFQSKHKQRIQVSRKVNCPPPKITREISGSVS